MELEQVMQALRNAHAAGDTEAARRLAAMAQNLKGQRSQAQPAAEPPAWVQEQAQALAAAQPEPGAIVQNVFGYGEADTPGERLGRVIQATGAGAGRGVEGLLNLPGDLARLAENAVIRPAYNALAPESMQVPQDVSAFPPRVETGIGEFQSQSTLEEYAGTVGEFLPGAALVPAGNVGLLGRLARFGAVPGVASEAAGQATEGTAAEPYARMAAGIAAGIGMTPRPERFGGAMASSGDEQTKLANYLAEQGVRPTAGQVTRSDRLMQLEGMLEPTAQQIDDFTAAAMRSIGSDSPRATPAALVAAQNRIVSQMDDAVQGVTVPATTQLADGATDIAARYAERVPQGSLTPRVRGIADEIADVATRPGGGSFSLAQLREWRSDIGRLTQSSDAATREAAVSLRRLIDDATDQALIAAGRESDIASLSQARSQYRNLLAIEDAATRAGAEGTGIITPGNLEGAVIRAMGRQSYALDTGTSLQNLARAGRGILRTADTVAPGAARSIQGALPAGLAGGGSFAGFSAGGIPGAIIGGTAGLLAPAVGRQLMRSNMMQSAIASPSNLAPGAIAGLLGGMAQ